MEALNRLIREPERRSITGISTTRWYADIKEGCAPPPVRIGGRVAWPLRELSALNEARIAGKTDDEIREIVAELVAARRSAAA